MEPSDIVDHHNVHRADILDGRIAPAGRVTSEYIFLRASLTLASGPGGSA